jgi:hypothetical protein
MLEQSIYETQLLKVTGLNADVTKSNWKASEIVELRTAFAATLNKDPGFLADIENMQVSLTRLPGDKR